MATGTNGLRLNIFLFCPSVLANHYNLFLFILEGALDTFFLVLEYFDYETSITTAAKFLWHKPFKMFNNLSVHVTHSTKPFLMYSKYNFMLVSDLSTLITTSHFFLQSSSYEFLDF